MPSPRSSRRAAAAAQVLASAKSLKHTNSQHKNGGHLAHCDRSGGNDSINDIAFDCSNLGSRSSSGNHVPSWTQRMGLPLFEPAVLEAKLLRLLRRRERQERRMQQRMELLQQQMPANASGCVDGGEGHSLSPAACLDGADDLAAIQCGGGGPMEAAREAVGDKVVVPDKESQRTGSRGRRRTSKESKRQQQQQQQQHQPQQQPGHESGLSTLSCGSEKLAKADLSPGRQRDLTQRGRPRMAGNRRRDHHRVSSGDEQELPSQYGHRHPGEGKPVRSDDVADQSADKELVFCRDSSASSEPDARMSSGAELSSREASGRLSSSLPDFASASFASSSRLHSFASSLARAFTSDASMASTEARSATPAEGVASAVAAATSAGGKPGTVAAARSNADPIVVKVGMRGPAPARAGNVVPSINSRSSSSTALFEPLAEGIGHLDYLLQIEDSSCQIGDDGCATNASESNGSNTSGEPLFMKSTMSRSRSEGEHVEGSSHTKPSRTRPGLHPPIPRSGSRGNSSSGSWSWRGGSKIDQDGQDLGGKTGVVQVEGGVGKSLGGVSRRLSVSFNWGRRESSAKDGLLSFTNVVRSPWRRSHGSHVGLQERSCPTLRNH